MRVLAVTPTFLPETGGIESVIFELASRAQMLGFTMDVAHISTRIKKFEAIQESGILIYRIPLRGSRLVGIAPDLAEIAHQYDLIHAHDPQVTSITHNLFLFCSKVPAVLSTHGGFWHTRRLRLFKWLYKRILLRTMLRRYKVILADSKLDYAHFEPYARNIVLCQNGIDFKSFSRGSAPSRSINQWICWGRLSRNKRIDLVIEYVSHARKLGFPVELLICGKDFDGLLDSLRAQVQQLGLSNVISFVAFLSPDELIDSLRKRAVFITATEYEGFGLSILEAMAAGQVVICRNIEPINNFVRHGKTGWHLAFDNSSTDQASLYEFLSQSTAQLSDLSASGTAVALEYDWDNVMRIFFEQYQQIIGS